MIWYRARCAQELNDRPEGDGTLLCEDALKADLRPWRGQAQCVYLDPPGLSGEAAVCRVRVGEEGWASGKPALLLPAYRERPAAQAAAHLETLRGLLEAARSLLNDTGSVFLHVDSEHAARARLLMDEVFGEAQFRNEIIWVYQTGGRSRRSFSRKHDVLLFYAKSPAHRFDISGVPLRREKRSNHLKRSVDEQGRSYRTLTSGGKTYVYYDDEPVYPGDVWADVSLMQQKDPQRTGYPAQRPQALLDRVILSTTRPGDLVADLTCGSGTALASAAAHGRRFLGVDASAAAFAVSRRRLDGYRLHCRAPLCEHGGAMLDAAAQPGVGFYAVTLNDFVLPPEDLQGLKTEPRGLSFSGLDCVDQWYAGLLHAGVFRACDSAMRTRANPSLPTQLRVPMLRGSAAALVVDVLGRRTLWTGSGAL